MQQRVPTSDASGVESRWRGAAAGDGGESYGAPFLLTLTQM